MNVNTTQIIEINGAQNPSNLSKGGALTCSYSRVLDFFAYGGSDSAMTFFNGTNNNNSVV
jgi:hypothetical protein